VIKNTILFILLVLSLFIGVGQVFGARALADLKPGVSTNLKCTLHNNLKISWSAVETANMYELDRRVVNGGWGNHYNGRNLEYEDTNLPSDKELEYRVRAKNENGWGPWSEPLAFRTTPIFKDINFELYEYKITPRR